MSVSTTNYNDGLVRTEPSFKHACCFIFSKKETARSVLDTISSIIKRYGFVSVYDLYLLIGAKSSTEDDFVGWEDIEGCLIKPTFNRKEYRLILPKLNCDTREIPY